MNEFVVRDMYVKYIRGICIINIEVKYGSRICRDRSKTCLYNKKLSYIFQYLFTYADSISGRYI